MEKTGSPFTTNELPLETNNRVLISDWPNNQLTMIISWPGRNLKKKSYPVNAGGGVWILYQTGSTPQVHQALMGLLKTWPKG